MAKTENDSYEDLGGDGLIVIYRRDVNENALRNSVELI